jgi:hypothetical protein
LKPERCGSPLFQEKYPEEKACDKRYPYRIIIVIIGLLNYIYLCNRNVGFGILGLLGYYAALIGS